MKFLRLFFPLILLIGISARSQSINNVTNGDVVTFAGASYSTYPHIWGEIFMSYWPCSHPGQTNEFLDLSRSGESWGGFWANEEEKWGLPIWVSHTNLNAQVRFVYPSDDNGGYSTTNALYTNGVLVASAPQSFFNGTAATNEGYNFPMQFDFVGNPPHDSSDGDSGAVARNLGCLILQTNYGRLPVDMWHMVWTNGWSNDVVGSRLLGYSTGSHPYEAGFVALTTVALPALGADTNVGSLTVDYNSANVVTNHFTASSVVNNGTSLSMTIRADRMPFGWPEGTGATNQGYWAFVACPNLSTWFRWVIQGTNFPSGAQVSVILDGTTIDTMTGAQFNSSGANLFTNIHGAFFAQRQAVVYGFLDMDGLDHSMYLQTHNAGSGGLLGSDNINYQSHSALYYDTDGHRGATYVTDMAPDIASLEKYDAAIYNAAQQTNHTLIISWSGVMQTVGPEAGVATNSSEMFCMFISAKPRDGSVQPINPPVFSWPYAENNATNSATTAPRFFEFQLTTNLSADYTAPYWDITCSNNFYNLLPPITNSDGSTVTTTVYWRIKYLSTNGVTVIATTTNHYFSLLSSVSGGTNWNRAMLADTNYLLGICTNHPHMLFVATPATNNIASLGTFLSTNTWPTVNQNLSTISNAAAAAQLAGYWTSSTIATTNSANGLSSAIGGVQDVAFMYLQSQSNAFWDVSGACITLSNCAVGWTNSNLSLDLQDPYVWQSGAGVSMSFDLAYDWLWPFMTAGQRAAVSAVIDRETLFCAYGDQWAWNMSPAITNSGQGYTNQLTVMLGSAFKIGVSHQRMCAAVGLMDCMATMGESSVSLGLYNLFQSYAIAKMDPYQGDEGRGYAEQDNFKYDRTFGAPSVAMMTFPSAQLWRAPCLTNIAYFFMAMEPPGFKSVFGSWGDLNGSFSSQWYHTRYYDLALETHDGTILRRYNKSSMFSHNAPDRYPMAGEAFIPYYFSVPTEADSTLTNFFDPLKGYLCMGSMSPTATNAFTSGFNIVTVARPSASRDEHANFSDGDVEMYYHGAQVTAVANPNGTYPKNPLYHNGVFVNGLGAVNAVPPYDALMGHFILYTNIGDTTVYGMDITADMNRTNNATTIGGSGGNFIQWYTFASNTVPQVQAIQEYGFDMHRRYYLRFIVCQTSTNSYFQTAWHIAEPTFTVNTNALSLNYTCTNIYNTNASAGITVYMQEADNPTEEGLLVESGTNNWKLNPFTGENLFGTDGDPGPYGNGVIWFTNKVATTNFTFFQSVYPTDNGQPAPTVTRWSDNTIEVNDGTYDDVVSVNTTNASPPSTLVLLTGNGTQNQGGQVFVKHMRLRK